MTQTHTLNARKPKWIQGSNLLFFQVFGTMSQMSLPRGSCCLIGLSSTVLGSVLLLSGCVSKTMSAQTLLTAHPGLRAATNHASDRRLQVLLSWVRSDPSGGANLDRSGYRVDAEYFYPASTIKLCGAVAAVQALEAGPPYPTWATLDTPLAFEPLFDDQQREASDETNLEGGAITLRHEIRKLFIVSDNQAYNRLYDFVGQEELNRRMWAAGATTVRLTHRLSEGRSMGDNTRTRAVEFMGPPASGAKADGAVLPIVKIPARTAGPLPFPIAGTEPLGLDVGTSYIAAEGKVEHPMNFADKNRTSLVDLQDMLVMTVRPDVNLGPNKPGFKLTPKHRAVFLQAMEELASESANPRYDPKENPDFDFKFLLPGLLRIAPRDQWIIRNKIGQAYGFSIENAYVECRSTGRACFVTATIFTCAKGVLNSDDYEYETVAMPFMADLGEAVGRELAAPAGR